MDFTIENKNIKWHNISSENLELQYVPTFLINSEADTLFKVLESDLQYFSGDLAKVKVYGKWHPIPRQQVAFGDEGLSYKFSGNEIPALDWHPHLAKLRDMLNLVTGFYFNFVLVNRYRNGDDHMGEHKDDESELEHNVPIASISLGQSRDFIFKHTDARRSGDLKRSISPIKLLLEHGSLLMMNPPTNKFWYHSLPKRKNCPNVRINLTFRKMTKTNGKNAIM
uniref:DNA oxidative demethylase ALKBH2 n=1 Tax=Clastoptera arizonana TaxID=38151 RepID=A0A1B6CYH9_9HEMI